MTDKNYNKEWNKRFLSIDSKEIYNIGNIVFLKPSLLSKLGRNNQLLDIFEYIAFN